MRTIIISDITENTESVIPYGLNIGKHTETRVEIVHFIDSRLVQGKYSSHSDSQSISAGEKLSHEEILQRVQNTIESDLDKLLSKEASRLNYPLRHNQMISMGELESSLYDTIQLYENPLLVTSTNPGYSMATSLEDLLSVAMGLNTHILVVPAELKFTKPENALLMANFANLDDAKTEKLFKWLNPLISSLNTAMYASSKDKEEAAKNMNEWKASAKSHGENIIFEDSEILQGDNPLNVLKEYIKSTNPDIVIHPKPKKSLGKKMFPTNKIKEITESLNKPFLFM